MFTALIVAAVVLLWLFAAYVELWPNFRWRAYPGSLLRAGRIFIPTRSEVTGWSGFERVCAVAFIAALVYGIIINYL